MKSLFTATLFVLAGALASGSAMAQQYRVRATVPFDFTVGNTLMPPGTYFITSDGQHVIRIWNKDTDKFVMTTVLSDNKSPGGTGRLVFTKYGDQYFLDKILCSAASMNFDVTPSKIEKRVRSEEARNGTKNQTTIALK